MRIHDWNARSKAASMCESYNRNAPFFRAPRCGNERPPWLAGRAMLQVRPGLRSITRVNAHDRSPSGLQENRTGRSPDGASETRLRLDDVQSEDPTNTPTNYGRAM